MKALRNLFNGKAFARVVFVCAAISLLLQILVPLFLYLASRSILCENGFLGEELKRVIRCPSSLLEQRRFRRTTTTSIAYFDDPLAVERWLTEEDDGFDEGKGEMVLRNMPVEGLASNQCHQKWIEAEAKVALGAAKRSRSEGNLQKAKTIIEHAYSLAPHHPDILTEYGIFLEIAHNDFVKAEGYYRKALAHDPHHREALIRRAKTLPLVEEIDDKMLKAIHQKRDTFLKIPRSDPGLKRALRESYFQHVYHTVALEGNTMSLMQTRSILETRMAVAGKSIVEHNEILGMDAALRFLNQTLTNVAEITLEDILAIHKRVLGFVDPLSAGVIRSTQVYVGSFTPTAPESIMREMEELICWLNDEETLQIDAVELAALAHYKLVYIHPFIDGNGRTSRLLMNFILMQAGFPPVIIPVEQRSRYYFALQQANEGDLRSFIRFIAEQTDRTLQGFIASSSVCGECHDAYSAELPPVILAGP